MTGEKKYVCGKQWIVDTTFADYKKFFPFLHNNQISEYSTETVSFGGRQYPLWCDQELVLNYNHHKDFLDYTPQEGFETLLEQALAWTQAKMLQYRFYHKLYPVISWYMDYDEGGWQGLHTHSTNAITQVIYLDPTTHITPSSTPKESGYGSMYALMASGDKTKYIPFVGFPGRCILMAGDVYHGVYPVKSTPRRTIIIDYMYNIK